MSWAFFRPFGNRLHLCLLLLLLLFLLTTQENCMRTIRAIRITFQDQNKIQQQSLVCNDRERKRDANHLIPIILPVFETNYEIKESNFILLAVMSSNNDCRIIKCTTTFFPTLRLYSFPEFFNCK